jgi:hypothetical protein
VAGRSQGIALSARLETRAGPLNRIGGVAVLAVLLGAVALAASSPGEASGRAGLARCGSVTIPISVTGTIPLHATDITVSGVTCKYATKTFLPRISKPGGAPPAGWTIKQSTIAGKAREDTCRHKAEVITFRFTL